MKRFFELFFLAAIFGVAMLTVSCHEPIPVQETVYTVTFDTDGGTPAVPSQQVEAGGIATAPANPSKTGFVFMFWSMSGATTAYNFQTPVTGDIILIARWQGEATVEYWQVTWNLDGGSFPANSNHATQVVKGGTLAEPNEPTKAGSTFDGWYREAALTNRVSFPYDVSGATANITLYAKWTAEATDEYWQVTWNLDGGSFPANSNHATQVAKGGTLAEPNAPTKEGSTFDGWYKEAALTNRVSFPYDVSGVTANITLYAKWTEEDGGEDLPYSAYFGTWRYEDDVFGSWDLYTISADKIEWYTNDGSHYIISGLTWTETVNPGGAYVAEYPVGYRVTGTFGSYGASPLTAYSIVPKADGSGNCSTGGGDIALNTFYISADRKSIARGSWSTAEQEATRIVYEKRTDIEYWQITYDFNGGEWMADNKVMTKVAKGGRLPLPGYPVKGDLVFEGWYADAALTDLRNAIFQTVTGNLTLYAKWSSQTYLQKAVYSMSYAIQIEDWVASGQRPTEIFPVLTVRYYGGVGGDGPLYSAVIYANNTLVNYYAEGGRQRPEYINGTGVGASGGISQIRNGTYNYARNEGYFIAIFFPYQPNNPFVSLSNLQMITNNPAITEMDYGNIRAAFPSYSHKMIVFGINSKKELMGKYIGYKHQLINDVFYYYTLDHESPEYGKGYSTMPLPVN